MFPQPWVSNNILNPSLSGSRWNQIRTVENKGNAFESHGLTELDVSHASYNTLGAVWDICAAISVFQKGAFVMTHMAQYPASRLEF